jgi:hypothetical protein
MEGKGMGIAGDGTGKRAITERVTEKHFFSRNESERVRPIQIQKAFQFIKEK